jgi:hypothetical protein
MQPNNQVNLNMNHIVPTVIADGSNVFISSDGDIPTVNFIQVRRQEGENVFADVVASVRLNNLDQLKELSKIIDETVKNHTEREK